MLLVLSFFFTSSLVFHISLRFLLLSFKLDALYNCEYKYEATEGFSKILSRDAAAKTTPGIERAGATFSTSQYNPDLEQYIRSWHIEIGFHPFRKLTFLELCFTLICLNTPFIKPSSFTVTVLCYISIILRNYTI